MSLSSGLIGWGSGMQLGLWTCDRWGFELIHSSENDWLNTASCLALSGNSCGEIRKDICGLLSSKTIFIPDKD